MLFLTLIQATTLLPIILRFGIRSWTFMAGIGFLMFFSFIVLERFAETESSLISLFYLIPLSCVFLAINSTLSYRLLASHPPWRSAAVKPM